MKDRPIYVISDPLGRFVLRDEDFRELTEIAMEIAAGSAGGRLLSILEGGYSLTGLAAAATAHVEALLHKKKSRPA